MSDLEKCPLCEYKPIKEKVNGMSLMSFIICPRCGEFSISDLMLLTWNRPEENYLLSGLAREITDTKGESPEFTTENIDEYLDHYLIPDENNLMDKANKLISWLRIRTGFYGEDVIVDAKKDFSLCYCKNFQEFIAIIQLLEESELLVARRVAGDIGGQGYFPNDFQPFFSKFYIGFNLQTVINLPYNPD